MESSLLQIIHNTSLSDNTLRLQAENQLYSAISQDPSQVAVGLVDISSNESLDIASRQSALACLKKVVASHWSIGFETFEGNAVSTENKQYIRERLLQLVASVDNSKIRNIVSNIVVTVGSVDYPDEWPSLLSQLYSFVDIDKNATENSLLGGLQVLYDLFDEIVTESQFFEAGIGESTLKYCFTLLQKHSLPSIGAQYEVPVKLQISVLKLFEVVLKQIQGPEVFNNPARAHFAGSALENSLKLLLDLCKAQYLHIQSIVSTVCLLNVQYIEFSLKTYEIITYLINTFNRKLFSRELKSQIQQMVIGHLGFLNKFYSNVAVVRDSERLENKYIITNKGHENDYPDPEHEFNQLIVQMIQLLGSNSECPISHLPELLDSILLYGTLPYQTYEMYVDDFNYFVTDETEMSGQFTVRHSIADYLSELQSQDSEAFLHQCLLLLKSSEIEKNWRRKESLLCCLQALFLNEDEVDILPQNVPFNTALEQLVSFATPQSNPLVIARSILVTAKFMEKFGQSTANFNDLCYKILVNCLRVASTIHNDDIIRSQGVAEDPEFDKTSNDSIKLIQSAALISVTYFNNFMNFNDKSLNVQIQQVIHELLNFIVDEAEEDTPIALLEALTVSINIDLQNSQEHTDDIVLIFKIAGVDVSNTLNVQTAKDALETLLSNINELNYIKQCELGLPSLIEILNQYNASPGTEFSSQLNMALELLAAFVENRPVEKSLPAELFNFIFAPLSYLLIAATDDQILQIGGEVFDSIITNSDKSFIVSYSSDGDIGGLEIMLKILSKFLSPELSDSAAMNVGSIVKSIINKFGDDLNENLSEILQSAIRRLLIAKNPVIIENLISVVCYIVLLSPSEALNFLSGMQLESKTGLEVVFPIWLDSFTTTRGYEGIEQNVKALGQIFLLHDERIENLVVAGDIIPNEMNPNIIVTRSMAKKMPTKYTQISGSLKILKLLVQELGFQLQQEAPEEVSHVDDSGNGDGWEDVDDAELTQFKSLKTYVDDMGKLSDDSSQRLKSVIKNFLVECIQREPEVFQKYFEQLSDGEKKIIGKTMA